MKTQQTAQRIEELKTIQEDLTTSDLQGIAEVIEMETGIDSNLILSYVYGEIELSEVLK